MIGEADHFRQERQWPLAVLIEKALCLQFLAAILQKLQQRAFARQFQPVDDDLIARGAGIGGELAGGDDLQPFLDADAEPRDRALPGDAVDDGILVLQAEVAVTGARKGWLADFAPHAHTRKRRLDFAFQRKGELGN